MLTASQHQRRTAYFVVVRLAFRVMPFTKEGTIMKTFVPITLVAGLCLALVGSASAAQCIRAGGWGTGALESFASFMAQAAMKNQAKAWGGDTVKIGKVNETCAWKTLAFECTAYARACK
jgi:hypothetical protein